MVLYDIVSALSLLRTKTMTWKRSTEPPSGMLILAGIRRITKPYNLDIVKGSDDDKMLLNASSNQVGMFSFQIFIPSEDYTSDFISQHTF